MESIKNLELYLFEGIPEYATRHYAVDTYAFDLNRETRCGILDDDGRSSAPIKEVDSPSEPLEYNKMKYILDPNKGMILVIE